MELFFPDELDWHVQDGFCLTDLLGHYINTGELPGVLSVGFGLVAGRFRFLKGRMVLCRGHFHR